jgi:PAS domain S-box-containing protein
VLALTVGHAQDTIPQPLRIGTEAAYPPYSFADADGRADGMNAELARAICDALSVDCRIEIGPWSDIRTSLEEGELDAVIGMFYSKQRHSDFDFSQPFARIQHVIIARKGDQDAESVEDIRGSRLLVMERDLMHDFAIENRLSNRLVLEDSLEAVLVALSEGTGDYALAARLPALFWISQRDLGNLEILAPVGDPISYTVAVAHGRKELLFALSDALASLSADGTFDEIRDRWLTVYESDWQLGRVLRYAGALIVALAVVSLLVVAWVWMLRRKVRARTADLSKSKARIDHLNRALQAIRNVNQLITQSREKRSLLQQCVRTLTETRGYFNAWILALETGDQSPAFYSCESSPQVTELGAKLERNEFPRCVREVLASPPILTTTSSAAECSPCPLSHAHEGQGNITVVIEHGNRTYGVLCVSVPAGLEKDQEERSLVLEVAGDLGFALHDIELQRDRDDLAESLLLARRIVEESPVVLFQWEASEQWPVTFASSNVSRFGYTAEELQSGAVSYAQMIHPQDLSRVEREVAEKLASGASSFSQAYRLVDREGRERWIVDDTTVHRDSDGSVTSIDGIVQDVTELNRAYADIERSRARLSALFDSVQDLIYLQDRSGALTHVNNSFASFRDSSVGELVGSRSPGLSDDHGRWIEDDLRVLSGATVRSESRVRKGGETRILETIRSPVRDSRRNVIGVCGVSRDVTEGVENRSRLATMAKENETLLRELYHRTKNNMQVVASMVALKRHGADSAQTAALLKDIEARIFAIGLVHQKLYNSNDLSRVDLADYLEDLIAQVHESYAFEEQGVGVRTDLQTAATVIDQAVPIGLAVNELLSNASKHAFVGRSEGTVVVTLRTSQDDLRITIADDGVGIADGTDSVSGHIGLQTVTAVVEAQLGGRLSCEVDGGTRWTLTIPRGNHDERE